MCQEALEKAIEFYKRSVNGDKPDYDAAYSLGNIYFDQEKFQLAEIYFKKATEIKEDKFSGWIQYALALLRSSKRAEALEANKKALSSFSQ